MFDLTHANALFVEGKYQDAARAYLDGARDGDADASYNYAYCLRYGFGVPRDLEKAKSFFAFAREADNGEALYNLAVMHIHGEGVKKNYRKAYEYMRASAEKECIEAQLYLGMLYTTGAIFDPDIVGITKIPTRAPEYRTPDDMLLMGDIPDLERDEDLRFGVVRADMREAFLWFRAAAYQQNDKADPDLVAKAQFLYAKCFLDGMGTDPSIEKAHRIMLLAGKNGSEDALHYLLENGVTPQNLIGSPRQTEESV